MGRITRRDHAVGRLAPVLVSILLAATTSFALRLPDSIAAVNTCRARDVTQGTAWSSDLHAVIRAATRFNVIAVKFVCVGNFKIAKPLTLVGKPTADLPYAVLNANGHGQVLVVSRAHVTLDNFKITGGSDTRWHRGAGITNAATLVLNNTIVKGNTGTGIYNNGNLTLEGASIVSHNSAAGIHNEGPTNSPSVTLNDTTTVAANSGYGIYSYYAHTILNGASSVTRNVTDVLTSVFNWEGELTLNDSASVTDNVGTMAAIDNEATFTMNGTSSVSGNTATIWWGGGVENGTTGKMTMNDSASIVGNSTVRSGGGVSNRGVLTMNGSSAITGNTSDADDNGVGGGGGIKVECSGTLSGAVDGGNVNDNYRGTSTPVENNIADPPPVCG
jgi:hypothetical protein